MENGEFNDPVLRCDSCTKLVKRTTLHNLGCCGLCGNKRIRALDVFNEDERDQIIEWGHESFLAAFEVAPNE